MRKVRVPESAGPEISVRYAGDDPVVYTVTNGMVEVEERRLEAFLAAVEGSALAAEPAVSVVVVDAEPASEVK
jgi:hypothetical protein